MSQMINFGIDLGTTNSLIAKFEKGVVEVFKNPIDFKETLPSVVGFRNDRILVGDQAKAFLKNDPKSVIGRFKRKMGTTESFPIKSLGQSKSPIELSALVLKELKTFIHTGEIPEAAVITIPASFDMVQSNATKEAGLLAGFKHVVLLQEPIAASLAFANKEKNLDLKNSQWIVYDLGGGTFDVALVKIVEGELKVVDHEGDNYLGGVDFDELIVERIIAPHLGRKGNLADLIPQMKSELGKYNRHWYRFLEKAEAAKIVLSVKTSAEIEIPTKDSSGSSMETLTITRSEYEGLIKDEIDRTAEMLKKILTRNSLRPQELKFVLMVGGLTYTPFVRKRIEELLGIPVNTGISPTNAIVIGAAYFAATREIDLGAKSGGKPAAAGVLRVKVSYNRSSKELEEMFSAKVEGKVEGLFYRIIRDDGGYNSGLKKVTPVIHEDLPLQEDAYNSFTFKILDSNNDPVPADVDTIQIAQGKYTVAGQMLPESLSLVRDDPDNEGQILDPLFERNTVLPAKCKRYVEASKTLIHGTDEAIRIIVVQGPKENDWRANKPVGHLVIPARDLKRDVNRGTQIELDFEASESCELKGKAYVTSIGQEYAEVFIPTYRSVPIKTLREEVGLLEEQIEQENEEAVSHERFEVAQKLKSLRNSLQEVKSAAGAADLQDVTDDRYKLEDRKRRIAQEFYQLTAGKRIERFHAEYQKAVDEATSVVNKSGNDQERRQLQEIVAQEQVFLSSKNAQRVQERIDQVRHLCFQIQRRTPEFLIGWFQWLLGKREMFNDQVQAKSLIEWGKKHVEEEDFDRLEEVIRRLFNLLPQEEDAKEVQRFFTGIR